MTTPTDTRSPADVNRSIHTLLGHTPHGHHWDKPDRDISSADYYHNLTALSEPEAKLREAGLWLTVEQTPHDVSAWWQRPIDEWTRYGIHEAFVMVDEAAARALAAEAALRAMQEAK